jgi:hypothetical protein
MGILSTIFGSSEVISEGFKLIDSMHTSKSEEIVAKVQGKVNLLNAYAPFKIAQRYLMLMFTITFLASFITVLVMTLIGVGDIDAVKTVLSEFYIGEIMFTIVGFYFGGGFLEGAINAKGSK